MLFPIYRHVQCSNGCCRHAYFVKTSDLVRAASRLACPVCHAVTQYAEVQAQQTGISQDAQATWKAIGAVAATIGAFMFVGKVIDWANS
jgi:hypothetical protein